MDKTFNDITNKTILHRSESFYIMKDSFPVSPGHLLIVSNNLKKTFFDLDEKELAELNSMIFKCKEFIEYEFNPDGYNIGMNCGAAAGQTILHFHCHVIPRYNGDMKDPRGGIRHCIAGKGSY